MVLPESHQEGIRKVKLKKSYDASTGYIIEKEEDEMLKFKGVIDLNYCQSEKISNLKIFSVHKSSQLSY